MNLPGIKAFMFKLKWIICTNMRARRLNCTRSNVKSRKLTFAIGFLCFYEHGLIYPEIYTQKTYGLV